MRKIQPFSLGIAVGVGEIPISLELSNVLRKFVVRIKFRILGRLIDVFLDKGSIQNVIYGSERSDVDFVGHLRRWHGTIEIKKSF